MVGISGRLKKVVAPNSPNEIVNAKIPADKKALHKMGNSICNQTRHGDAPKTAADCLIAGGIETITGCKIRTTNGRATNECAIGIKRGNDLTSNGGLLKVSKNPSPKVTADVPNGNMIITSNQRSHLLEFEIAFAAKKPKTKAIKTVTNPIHNELRKASKGGT